MPSDVGSALLLKESTELRSADILPTATRSFPKSRQGTRTHKKPRVLSIVDSKTVIGRQIEPCHSRMTQRHHNNSVHKVKVRMDQEHLKSDMVLLCHNT
jgi:hypothetical protein